MNNVCKTRLAGAVFPISLASGNAARAEDVTLSEWSHEADEPAKVALREQAARNLAAKHPGLHVKIGWCEKNGLDAAPRSTTRNERVK